MILSHHLIPTTLLISTLTFACATTPISQDSPNIQPPPTQQQKTRNPKDPLQTAEHWLKTGQSADNQPIHTAFWTELQSWNSPRVTRFYLKPSNGSTSLTEYIATITDPDEPPERALQLTISQPPDSQQKSHWQITHIQQIPARQLWPRF